MKEFLYNLALFVVIAAALSSLEGCSGKSGEQSRTDGPTNVGGSSGDTAATKKPSIYPPLATAIAQSDVKNIDGSTFKIADRKGKVLLLNMWATWCGPCRAEMPALVKMQDEFRDQGFEVIGFNSDDEPADTMNAFAKSMNLNYQLVWPDTQLLNDLLKISQFGGIPQSFLVDREGNLRGVFKGANPSDVRKMQALVAKVVTGDDTPLPDTAQSETKGSDAAVSLDSTSSSVPAGAGKDSSAKTSTK